MLYLLSSEFQEYFLKFFKEFVKCAMDERT